MIKDFLEKNKNSKLREQVVEYKFLSSLFIASAINSKALEVLRSEHDSFGFDVILKVADTVKYVQLKSKRKGGKTTNWDIHKSLLLRDSGTVVLLEIDYDDSDFNLLYGILDESRKKAALDRQSLSANKGKCRITTGDLIKNLTIEQLYSKLFVQG